MDIWPPKEPSEIVAYPIDWQREFGSGGAYYNDSIETFTLVVTDGDAEIEKSELNCNIIRALISGGTNETTTTFLNTINTANGQVLEREITLYVADGSVPYAPSTATKRLVIDMAFDEVRMSVPEFQISPGELNTELTKLDMLMDEWAVSGIYLGYNAPTIPGDGDLDDPIGIPNAALHATALYLAMRISPAFGKKMMTESQGALSLAMLNLRGMTASIPNMRYPRTTPIGQGNRWWFFNNYPFASGRNGCN